MPSLSEIGLRRLVRGVSLRNMSFSDDGHICNIFLQIPIQLQVCLYEQNKSNETIQRLLINTVPAYMPIDEMPIVRSFLSILRMAQSVFTVPSSWSI